MSETLYTLTASYGIWLVCACAYLSCLAIPIPTALVMLAAGAFSAAGDLPFLPLLGAAWGAAVLGDQTGYWIGRRAGPPIIAALSRAPSRAALIARGHRQLQRSAGVGVFLSTWLFAPLGPWVNLLAGATDVSWRRFTLADISGEAIWVTVYLGLGYLFGDRLDAIAGLMGNLSGFLAAGAVTVALGALLLRHHRDSGPHGRHGPGRGQDARPACGSDGGKRP